MRFTIFITIGLLWIHSALAQSLLEPDAIISQPLPYCDETLIDEAELVRFKRQAIQSVAIHTGAMADPGDHLLSSHFLETSISSGIPLGDFDNIVGVKPKFRIDWIDARSDLDVPDKLYEFELQFFYRRPLGERLSAITVFSPAIRSDLTTSDEAFRVFALALLNWQSIPDRLVLSGGAVYLGRADLPVLPALGLSWTPDRRTQIDLRFPSSRAAYRIEKQGAQRETWTYFDIGLGGNTWAVTRADETTDELSLSDLRMKIGIESIFDGGGGWFVEGGWALNRRLEYERDESEIAIGDGLLMSGGWRY